MTELNWDPERRRILLMAVKPREALQPHLPVSRLCMSNSLMELVSSFKWKMKSHSVSRSVMPNSYNPMDCNPPDSSVHGIVQARLLEWVAISFSRDLPHPGIEPRSLALQADSLPSEPPEKPLLFHYSVVSDSLQPHGLQHARLPCPSPSPGACSNSCPLSR